MKLVFYSNSKFTNLLNLPLKPLSESENSLFRLGRDNQTGSPPIPANIFPDIPKNSVLIYDIFSLDCCLDKNGNFSSRHITEDEALKLACGSPVYHDDISMSAYFRYEDRNGQHTVWLEDTYHQIIKIDKLESMGFESLGIIINDISVSTVVNLIHTDRYSI